MKSKEYIEKIVDRFVNNMEQYGKDWSKPWIGSGKSIGFPMNSAGKKYRGCNVFGLMIDAIENGYTSNKWGTYNQWKKLGRRVPKGSGSHVLYYGSGYDEEKEKSYNYMKVFPVWNECQLLDYVEEELEPKDCKVIKNSEMEYFISALRSDINYQGDIACYIPAKDKILMPKSYKFIHTVDATATQNFYSTLLHEHIHWTGHKSRLDRNLEGASFKNSYAYEELIAELGTVLLAVEFELEPEPTADHAKYINSWMQGLKKNPKALINAMSEAQKAVTFMHENSSNALNFA